MSTNPEEGEKKENPVAAPPEEMDDTPLDMNPPEMSAEQMDALLKESDPEFMKSVEEISADKTLTLEEEEHNEGHAALVAEVERWQSYTGAWKILYKVFPYAPHVSLKSKNIRFKIRAFYFRIFVQVKNFLFYLAKEKIPKTITSAKESLAAQRKAFSKASYNFKYLKWQTKILFYVSAAFIVAAGYVVFKSVKKDFLKEDKPLFISGLGELANQEYSYEQNEVEPYINNARAAQNVILTRKIFVNLKPSSGSGRNPMAAFEFYIEGMTSDVVIEIKDRESKIQDLMQRSIEDTTFEELDTEQGKKDMTRRLQEEISKVLTTGSVKAIRIKTIILKP